MLLLDLPLELLLEIWDALDGVKAMNAIVQTCHYTYDNLDGRLYQFAVQQEDCWQTLQWAAAKCPESTIRKLLDAGIDPAQSGSSALFKAVERGRLSVVHMLLQHGLDPNETDGFGRTALHQASLQGNVEIARALLDAGADLRARDFDGWDAFSWAVHSCHAGGVISLLINRGVSVDQPVSGGELALGVAALRGRDELLRILLDAGADLQATNRDGMNALHKAAMGGRASIAKLLLDSGAAPDIPDGDGRTALYWACSSRRPQKAVVELLLQRTVEVDARKLENGGTPLSIAATLGFAEAIEPLLAYGADPTVTDDDGCTPLALAARYGHAATVLALLDNEHQKPEWHIDTPDNRNRTPLFLATVHGYEHIVRILLKRGSTAVETPTSAGRTPLLFVHDYQRSDQTLFSMWMWLSGLSDTTVDLEGVEESSKEAKYAIAEARCDRCQFPISVHDTHFNCGICDYGDFDICLECLASGETCFDAAHILKKVVRGRTRGDWTMLEDVVIHQPAMTVDLR